MKTTTITLGGQTYTVAELPLRQNAAWRQRLSALVASVTDLVGALQIDLANTGDLVSVVNQVRDVLLEAPDQVAALLFDYAPELAADRVRIENEVYESELLTAFVEVLKLAYPFGDLLRLANGLAPKASASTSTS
jgi:hypothetical protein